MIFNFETFNLFLYNFCNLLSFYDQGSHFDFQTFMIKY